MRGNIRRRGKNSFELRFELDRVDGKRRQQCVTFRGSYKDAQKELSRLIAAADAGTLSTPTSDTIADYLRGWLDSTLSLSPKTKERYQELAESQIIPHLGAIKLGKLTPERIEQWHADLIRGGLSARTVGHAHRVLSRVLRRAVENGALSRNVCKIRRPPMVEAQEIEILSGDELGAVLVALEDHTVYPIAFLAAATGMRRGELLALEWRDVELDAATIRVERSVEETKARGLRIKSPKTKRGRRSIGISAEAVTMLRDHRKGQIELRLALGQGGQPKLVFGTIADGLLSPNNITRSWSRALRTRGLKPVSFHALRHTHVSLLIRAGVDILTISRRIGHSKASITLDVYGHLVDGGDDAAVAAMEGVLK
jgi:integrase